MFSSLKSVLSSAPVLHLVDPSLPLRVETDSSDFALGSLLSIFINGHWHPVAYESQKLDSAETHYPIHEKELLVLIHSLKVWRHYLLG